MKNKKMTVKGLQAIVVDFSNASRRNTGRIRAVWKKLAVFVNILL